MANKRSSLVESMKRDEDQLDPTAVDNFLKHGTAAPKEEETEQPAPRQKSPETLVATKINEPQTDATVMTPGLSGLAILADPGIISTVIELTI